MRNVVILLAALALTGLGCNSLDFTATRPDGTQVSVKSRRFVWSTEAYAASITTNTATINATKSSVDAAAIQAAAAGVAQGLATSIRP